jgi:signal transduction histidine kinase
MMEIKLFYVFIVFILLSIVTIITILHLVRIQKRHQHELREAKLKAERDSFNIVLQQKELILEEVSRELHDMIGVKIFGLGLLLESEQTLGKLQDPIYSSKFIEALVEEINEIALHVRSISHEYQPRVGSEVSLQGALENFIQRSQESRKHKVKIHFSLNENEFSIQKATAVEIYRILTELIKNILQHSQADYAEILIYPEEELVLIWVKDNGIGLEHLESNLQGIGLKNIQTRLRIYGGKLLFEALADQNGTCIYIEMPQLKSTENENSHG